MYLVLKYSRTNSKSKSEKGDTKIERKLLEITTLHGLTIDELIDLKKISKETYRISTLYCDYEIQRYSHRRSTAHTCKISFSSN